MKPTRSDLARATPCSTQVDAMGRIQADRIPAASRKVGATISWLPPCRATPLNEYEFTLTFRLQSSLPLVQKRTLFLIAHLRKIGALDHMAGRRECASPFDQR
jgi:hypothetical protein